VIGAIAECAVRDIREHKLLTLRTILIGLTVIWVSTPLIGDPLSTAIRRWILPHLLVSGLSSFIALWMFDLSSCPPIAVMYVLAGWTVRRLQGSRGGSIVLVFAFTVLIDGLARSTDFPVAPIQFSVSMVIWRTVFPTFFVLLGGLWATNNFPADRAGVRT
jgi:hypothetical protein